MAQDLGPVTGSHEHDYEVSCTESAGNYLTSSAATRFSDDAVLNAGYALVKEPVLLSAA
jgi:hypothetical protein